MQALDAGNWQSTQLCHILDWVSISSRESLKDEVAYVWTEFEIFLANQKRESRHLETGAES